MSHTTKAELAELLALPTYEAAQSKVGALAQIGIGANTLTIPTIPEPGRATLPLLGLAFTLASARFPNWLEHKRAG